MNDKEFSSMSVADLRSILVKEGYTENQVNNIKGKSNLVAELLKLRKEDNEDMSVVTTDSVQLEEIFDSAEEVNESQDNTAKNSKPDILSPEWNDYVLTLFTPEELDNGYPKVDGLRRISQMLLGRIVFSGPVVLNATMDESQNGRANCIYEVRFKEFLTDEILVYRGAASAFPGSVDVDFCKYPETIAETRAEVRALRKALRLRIPGAEEMVTKPALIIESKSKESDGEWNMEGKITETQIIFITNKCNEMNIDMDKYINSGTQKYNNIRDVTKSTAAKMIEQLNKFQTCTDKSKSIPSELLKGS